MTASVPTPAVQADRCGCGSGLGSAKCCALDWTTADADDRELGPLVEQAAAAYGAGDMAEATRAAIEAVELAPRHPGALTLLGVIRRGKGQVAAAAALLRRVLRVNPNHLAATQELALLLFDRGALAEAEVLARNAVRLAPIDPQSHNLMGMIMTEANRPQVGEFHYRRALALLANPSPILLANLAWNLKNQGRMAESRALYEQSLRLDPTIPQTLLGCARMEETDRNFARAAALLDEAERVSPGNPSVLLARAVLHGRNGADAQAMAALGAIARQRQGELSPLEWTENGRLLDRMGRPEEAFAAWSEGKRRLRALSGQAYQAEHAEQLARRLKGFFTAGRLEILPRASRRSDLPQPIFILGFPRSGTTMVEQTLSAHPRIAAGDELPMINDLTAIIPRLLASPLDYPEALVELWFGDQSEGLDNLRDYYLHRARQLGAMGKGVHWFTDKMPLNETHLGLIALIFPEAPLLHVLRHPLDVVLSVFANHLTHGFHCANALDSIARHYLLVVDLVEHYRAAMPLRYLALRYEDIVADQERQVREMLGFIGAGFDRRCLAFHENRRYARTASYAQVTEKLYARSCYRYRAYLKELAPVIPMLEPAILRLGYSV
jgi:Flp pilus assembly protein TadD